MTEQEYQTKVAHLERKIRLRKNSGAMMRKCKTLAQKIALEKQRVALSQALRALRLSYFDVVEHA